jgi:hypothetical protein
MKAIKFPEVNLNIAEDQPEYSTLPSYIRKDGLIVNCFELNQQEIENVLISKKIWIHHWTGGTIQPFNIIAVNDYFSSVIHDKGRFTIQEEEFAVEDKVEAVLNEMNITTPIQSLYVHMAKKYNLILSDEELKLIVNISKEI